MTCSGLESVPKECKHITGKILIEKYLKESGISYSIVRPTAFFENFDDNANYNPLKIKKVLLKNFFLRRKLINFVPLMMLVELLV